MSCEIPSSSNARYMHFPDALKDSVKQGSELCDMDCDPFPEVASTLRPFIRTRDEVATVRGNLHVCLEEQLGFNDIHPLHISSLEHTHHDTPTATSGSLIGLRKAYFNALQAHEAAEAKLQALKDSIQDLPQAGENKASWGQAFITKRYVPFLRKSEVKRNLHLITGALEDIQGMGSSVIKITFEDVMKSSVGDLPSYPGISFTNVDEVAIQQGSAELKKAVLAAKQELDAATDSASSHMGEHSPSPQAQLFALRQAQITVVDWIEDNLSRIAVTEDAAEQHETDDGDIKSASSTLAKKYETSGIGSGASQQLNELYQQYLTARRRLIQSVRASASAAPSSQSVGDLDANSLSPPRSSNDISHSFSALPYISQLASLKQQEASLVQQGGFVHLQLRMSKDDVASSIARLAGESHMVQPGATRGTNWKVAAENASDSTHNVVTARVEDGGAAASSAERTLDEIQYFSETLARALKKDPED